MTCSFPDIRILSMSVVFFCFLLIGHLSIGRAVEGLEVVPEMTPELTETIRRLPPLQARLVTGEDGGVNLQINGKNTPPFIGNLTMCTPRKKLRVKVWREAGVEFVMVPYDLGMMNRGYGYVTPPQYNRSFWDGPGTYVREDVETVLWRVLAVYPEAKIILWPWIDVYPGWDGEHPEELMRNADGKAFIASTHFLRVGSDPDREHTERYAWSLFSRVFRSGASTALREFIDTVKGSVPGKRVVGYIIGGGQDAQLYAWDPPNFSLQSAEVLGDYSRPAVQAWKAWLAQKYGSPQALSAAWDLPVGSFEEAAPPEPLALLGPEPFFNPVTERRCIDWRRFLAEGRAELVSWFAKEARAAAGNDVLIGASGGDGGARFTLSASALLLQDPNIDLLWHQATYGSRIPPNTGGINAMLGSHALHNKLFIADMDHRTWLTQPLASEKKIGVISFSDQSVGRAQNMAQLRSMWRRELALLWASAAGAVFHPLGGAESYEDADIVEELKFLRAKADRIPVPSAAGQAGDIAVIYDERAVSYLKGGLAKLHYEWVGHLQAQLRASGVPYRLYYADDFRKGLIPPAKAYVFVNQLDFDGDFVREVEKLKGGGRTLIWLQNAGWAQAGTNPVLVSETIGIEVKPLRGSALSEPGPRLIEGLCPIGLRSQTLEAEGGVGWAVTDEKAVPLAVYSGDNAVGLAFRNHGDWKSFFVGNSTLSPGFFNALAEFSGAWRIAPAGHVVAAGPDWVSIHPLTTGEVELVWKKPTPLKAWWPENIASPAAQRHPLSLDAGTTYIFDTK